MVLRLCSLSFRRLPLPILHVVGEVGYVPVSASPLEPICSRQSPTPFSTALVVEIIRSLNRSSLSGHADWNVANFDLHMSASARWPHGNPEGDETPNTITISNALSKTGNKGRYAL